MAECQLCKIVDYACDRLPTEEARRRCKELSQRVMKGELDGESARQELLKHVDKETFEKVVREALSKL
jgi:hypothetical protein